MQSTFRDVSFQDLRDLAESAVTVAASVEVGLFAALHSEPASARELAERLGLDARALGIVLPVLVELGLVESEGVPARFRLSERGRMELGDPGSPRYQAGGLALWLENLRAWTFLGESLRTGRPVRRAGADEGEESAEEEPGAAPPEAGDADPEEEERRRHIARFMAAMAAAPAERVERLVDTVLARQPEAHRILDVGGGPGHIARAFVARGLEAVLLDRPEVVDFVREAYGLDRVERLGAVGADFLADPLPSGPFDVVLLSNVLHMLSPEECAALLRKVRGVLAPGGVVAIADFLRGQSPRAARFALVMLLRTESGDTYTLREHERWLDEAGFSEVQVRDLDPERQLVTAVAAGGPRR